MQILIEEAYKGKITKSIVAGLFEEVVFANPIALKGVRGAVIKKSVSGINLVVRLYRRGGIARYFLSMHFLKLPFLKLKDTRPMKELLVLKKLEGLSVPTPVAVGIKSNRFSYSGILITKEISSSQTLLECPPPNLDFTKACVEKAGQITKMIVEKGVYHPDLHLGNVLYQSSGAVYIIDFDRATFIKTEQEKKKAIDKISVRWTRSVKKWMGDEPAVMAVFNQPFLNALMQ